jgi:Putative auto-transporter adhesin, head GIN domain
MKKLVVGLICLLIVPFSLRAADVVKEIPVGAFSELDVSIVGSVYLIQGDKEAVRVESDRDVSKYFEVTNVGNKLTVKTTEFRDTQGDMAIYITVRNLNSAYFKAVGNIRTKNVLKFNSLKMTVSAACNISLDLDCGVFEGDFSAVGNVQLTGKANRADIRNAVTGNLRAGDFKTGVLSAHLAGVGNVTLYADKEISIEASGTGNVTYKGNPVVKHLSKHGTGVVRAE